MYGGSHASAPGWVRVGLAGTSKFAVNTSGLGAGTDVFTVDQAGNLTVSGTISSGTATLTLNSSANTVVLQSAGTTALTLDASQNATFAGTVTASGNISSNAVFGSSSGTLYLRPNGISVASGQATIDTSGNATFAGILTVSGTGTNLFNGTVRTRQSGATRYRGDWFVDATGAGLNSYDDTGAVYRPLRIDATTFKFNPSGGSAMIDASSSGVTISGAIAIGNTVNTVSPTSPNRTITMVIGGTTYYIHAKTTND